MKAILLEGSAGTGKTALAEYIAKMKNFLFKYILCHEWTIAEDFLFSINIPAVAKSLAGIKQDDFYLKGVLANIVSLSQKQSVLLLIDEIDKANSRIDALLLDFLQNCRVVNPEGDIIYGNEENIYVFITSNKQRELIEPLQRRLFKFTLHHLPQKIEADLLVNQGEFFIDESRDFLIRYTDYVPVIYKNQNLQNLLVKVANKIREAGFDISLYEMQKFYLFLPVCKNRQEVEWLIEGWLCRNDEITEFLNTQFKSIKNLANAFFDLYKRGASK